MRIILFTGKGGVGKTTVAAATALIAAEKGYKTIILSTDPAHSLSDAFETPLSHSPLPIAPNLWGQETSVSKALATYWKTIKDWLVAFLSWGGIEEMIAEEVAILPGMDELANLLFILDYAQKGDYDAIIVDCAPTGETLRLLSFPEVLRWWMEKVFPLEKKAAKVVRPLFRNLLNIPFPEEEVFAAVEDLYYNLDRLFHLLTNPDISSVRLVVNAEKMVIKETQRTFTYLNLYGYVTDLIICNRLFPQDVKDAFFDNWLSIQGKYYKVIEECFSPVPIRTIPLFPQEVVGIERLRLMAKSLYNNDDPIQIFFKERSQRIEKGDNYYILTLSLPFASKEDLSLFQGEEEVIVQVGNFRRNILLPRILRDMEVKGAKFEGGHLKLRFERKGG